MLDKLTVLKGIHPGLVLDHILREKGIRKGHLALRIREFPQTLTQITKGKRGMNTALALKLERELELEEGFFMVLQVYYEIHREKGKDTSKPDLSKLRPVLFWDTDMGQINWQRQYRSVVRRVWERGNSIEKEEMRRFYGDPKIRSVIGESIG